MSDQSKIHRCSICNSVSVEDIQTNIGDFKGHIHFTPDPKSSLHYICTDCSDSINDVMFDYQLEDEYGKT